MSSMDPSHSDHVRARMTIPYTMRYVHTLCGRYTHIEDAPEAAPSVVIDDTPDELDAQVR